MAKAAGDDTLRRECQGKIVALNQKYTALARQIGVKPEYDRGFVNGFRDVKIEDAKTEPSERERLHAHNPNTVSINALEFSGYREKFSGITGIEAVDKSIHACAKAILEHRNGTNQEDLYLIDGKTGDVIHALTSSTSRNSVTYDDETQRAIREAHSVGRSIISIHNHPNGLPPTLDDGVSALIRGYDAGVVVGHNLEVWKYGKSNVSVSETTCNAVHGALAKRLQFEFDFDDSLWYTVLRRYGMKIERR